MIFKEYSFLDLLSVIIDNRGKTVPVSEGGIPLIATNCIKNETLYPAYDKVRYVSKSTYDTWFRGHPQPGDMIFTCKGSPGRVCWVPDPIDFCIAQDMVGIRANEKIIYPKYLFALLRSEGTQNKILNMHVGTLIPHFKKGDFGNLYFDIPTDMEYQKKVGDAYFDFCLKIEANRQTSQTLEHIAQAIFKSWFVDFEPTRAKIAAKQIAQARQDSERSAALKAALFADGRWPEAVAAAIAEGDPERAAMAAISGKSLDELDAQGCANAAGAGSAGAAYQLSPEQKEQLLTTAALFPDALVDSELGGIPKGWEVKALDEIAHYQNGLALQKFRPEDENNFLPVLKIAQLKKGFADGEEKASPNIKPECIVDNGDVVFSWSGSLVVDVWCGGKAALNQHLFKVTSPDYPKWFYCYWTKHHLETFQQVAADKAVTMGHIKRSHLDEAKCIVPSCDLDQFSLMANFLEKQIEQRLESIALQEIRDSLLPKLLSGESSIPEHTEHSV